MDRFTKQPVQAVKTRRDSNTEKHSNTEKQGKCPYLVTHNGVEYKTSIGDRDWRPVRFFQTEEDSEGVLIWLKERWDNPSIVTLLNDKFAYTGTTVVRFAIARTQKPYFYYALSAGLGPKPQSLADFGAIKPELLEGKVDQFFDEIFSLMLKISQITPSAAISEEANELHPEATYKPCWYKTDTVGKREKEQLQLLGYSEYDLDVVYYGFPAALKRSSQVWTMGRVVLEDAFVGNDGAVRILVGPQASFRRNLGGDYARLLLYCLESESLTQAYFSRLADFVSKLPNDESSDFFGERFKCMVVTSIILGCVNRYVALVDPVMDDRFRHDLKLIDSVRKRQEEKGQTVENHLKLLEKVIKDAVQGLEYFSEICPDLGNKVFA